MLKFLALIFLTVPANADHFVSGCRVYENDPEKKLVATFPGTDCAFRDDGTAYSLGQREFAAYYRGKKIFHRDLRGHAEFSLTEKGDVLLLSFEKDFLDGAGRPTLEVIGPDGTTRRKKTGEEIFGAGAGVSVTDFAQLPLQKGSARYYVNRPGVGIVFLDETLTAVSQPQALPGGHPYSRARILRDGRILTLRMYPREHSYFPEAVTADVFRNGKLLFRYPGIPSKGFLFPFGGSLTESKGNFILNHPLSGTYILSGRGELRDFFPDMHMHWKQMMTPRTVERRDLSRFLENWKW